MGSPQLQVSVVVATHERPARLAALIESMRAQDLDSDSYELIVVDDASTDRETHDLLERESRREGMSLQVIRRPVAQGPAAARNDGWRAARAPLVAFTDDDCVATPGWLEAGLAAWRSHPNAVIQGLTEPNPAEAHRLGPFTRTIRMTELGPYYQTANVFFPRELLERLDGFDAARYPLPGGEDTDLAWRAFELGADAVLAPDARIFHAVMELGPLGILRVAARWRLAMDVYVRHPQLREIVFTKRFFWKYTHYLLVRALPAVLLPRRLGLLRGWFAFPYLRLVMQRTREEGVGLHVLAFYVLHDLVELQAVARAGWRLRSPML